MENQRFSGGKPAPGTLRSPRQWSWAQHVHLCLHPAAKGSRLHVLSSLVPSHMCFCHQVKPSQTCIPVDVTQSTTEQQPLGLCLQPCFGQWLLPKAPRPLTPHLLHRAPHATRTFPSAHHKDVTASGCPICVTAAALHPGCCKLCVRMGWGSTCHQGHRKLSPGRARRSQGNSHGDYSEPQTHH